MNAIDGLASLGGWGLLLAGSASRLIWQGRQAGAAANWLLSLSVVLFYYLMVLRRLFAGLDWELAWSAEFTRFDVSAALVPAGLFCCWFGNGRWVKGLGAALIVAGFVNVFPGLLYPIEYIPIKGSGTGN